MLINKELSNGGGGGIRTRVRQPFITRSTCLAISFI